MIAGFYQFSPVFGRKQENFEKVFSAVDADVLDLLVLPELFATGYQFLSGDEVASLAEPVPEGETTSELCDFSRKKKLYIVAGLAEAGKGGYYNSAVLTGPEGFIGSYRKVHLFADEKKFFAPGDSGFRVWETGIGRIGIMVCFDWFFPESTRTLAVMGADVIAHPSNLVLPYCPDSMPVRCLENRVYAVTANRIGSEQRQEGKKLTFIGQSEIVGPDGKIIKRASAEEEVLMTADIDPCAARDKRLNEFNDLIGDRRPGFYR